MRYNTPTHRVKLSIKLVFSSSVSRLAHSRALRVIHPRVIYKQTRFGAIMRFLDLIYALYGAKVPLNSQKFLGGIIDSMLLIPCLHVFPVNPEQNQQDRALLIYNININDID